MNGEERIQDIIPVIITLCLVLIFCMPSAAESTVQVNSKVCVNGYCTLTSAGYPDYYPYPDYYYPDYTQYPGYPGFQERYPYGTDYRYYCSPYRTSRFKGYLNAGQYRVYGFRIGGQRSYIEWILNGGCGSPGATVMMSNGPTQVHSWRQTSCGADFDIYVYQNRYPCSSCRADRSDTGRSSNGYVGFINPCQGCYYTVVIYCRSGAGSYDLTSNSYVNNCWYPNDQYGPVMMSTVEEALSAGMDDTLLLEGSPQFEKSDVLWDEGDSPGMGDGYYSGYYEGNWQPPSYHTD